MYVSRNGNKSVCLLLRIFSRLATPAMYLVPGTHNTMCIGDGDNDDDYSFTSFVFQFSLVFLSVNFFEVRNGNNAHIENGSIPRTEKSVESGTHYNEFSKSQHRSKYGINNRISTTKQKGTNAHQHQPAPIPNRREKETKMKNCISKNTPN